ncbi:MAG: hypothetical protein ACRENG_00840 [bacterium]
MQLNYKLQELVDQLVKDIETKFPEVKFVSIEPSPESVNSWWLDFTKPDDEDRLIELSEYASERAMDILLDYGYHLVVLPVVENGKIMAAV